MQHEYVYLNKVQTHLITWGNPAHCGGRDVVVCISGNPGITDFYIEFGSEIHESTGFPLCIIGQAGHEEVIDKNSNVLKGQEHLFNLEGQLQHKLELINNYIDKQSKLHLVGHSIGAWLILQLLKDNENLFMRVSSVNLLFPTLQRMAESRNGKFLNYIIRKLHSFFLFLFFLAFVLPVAVRKFLVEVYLRLQSLPLYYSKRVFKFLNPAVGEKVLFLAYNEMDTVKELNTEVLDRIKHYTNVIYSSNDGWVPLSYMADLQEFQPDIDLNEVDIDHAFVLKSSERVGGMVSRFIRRKF